MNYIATSNFPEERLLHIRTPDAIDGAIAQFSETLQARREQYDREDLAEALIARMVNNPWRIGRAVYRIAHWPADGKSADTVLAECREKIAGEEARRAHWTFDSSRLVALREAEKALERMLPRMGGGRG